MESRIIAAALAVLLTAPFARAEEAKAPTTKQSIMTFFKHLKESLATSAVSGERKKSRVGAVAAVRGADQKNSLADPNEPVLKGDFRAKREKAAAAEDAEFAGAVDLILHDKTEEGMKALEDFKAKHPKSRSFDRVQEALDQAKALKTVSEPKAETPAKN